MLLLVLHVVAAHRVPGGGLIGASIIPLVLSVNDTRRHGPPLEQPA
jgi:hypothetical protein